MIDGVLIIDGVNIQHILKNGYYVQENQPIVLSEKVMADGTTRQNIAEKKKTIITLNLSKMYGDNISKYLQLFLGDREVKYYSPTYKEMKIAIFRVPEKPTVEMILAELDLYEEFEVILESV